MPRLLAILALPLAVVGCLPAQPARDSARPGVPSREDIVACLEREDGKIARVARRLDVDRTALYRLMKGYGIDRESRED